MDLVTPPSVVASPEPARELSLTSSTTGICCADCTTPGKYFKRIFSSGWLAVGPANSISTAECLKFLKLPRCRHRRKLGQLRTSGHNLNDRRRGNSRRSVNGVNLLGEVVRKFINRETMQRYHSTVEQHRSYTSCRHAYWWWRVRKESFALFINSSKYCHTTL